MQEESDPAARKGATPPPTDAERLWKRYQLPEGKGFPDDRLPLDRYHWNLLILRLGLPDHIKAVAGALATLGNADGSNVITTDPRLLAAFNIKERQLRDRIAVLHEHKLLHVVERPGGRGVAKTLVKGKVRNAIVCQLTEPADGKLPYRLDADFLPIEPIDERRPGAAPVAAIEANRTARAGNPGATAAAANHAAPGNTGSATAAANQETPAAALPEQAQNTGSSTAGVSDETPADSLPQQDRNTGSASAAVSDASTGKHRHSDYRGNDEAPAAAAPQQPRNTGSPATAVSEGESGNSGGGSAAATPVDDEKHRQPQRRSSPETPAAGVPKHRQPECRSNENPGTAAAGAASRVEVLKTQTTKTLTNPTTRVVQLGGDLTSGPGGDAKSDSPIPADDEPSQAPELDEPTAEWEPASAAAAVSFQPTEDPEYDRAREIVGAIPLDEIGELLGNAQSELEVELDNRFGSTADVTPTHRMILIRAAEIVQRAEAAGHGPATDHHPTEGTDPC